jgi:Fe-Mn family superoxide dismutase
MPVEPKPYPLEGKLKCMTDKTLQQHRDVLYKGYVTNYNKVQEAIGKADLSAANPHFSDYSEAKRREGWTHNGVILHEWYFENLGGQGTSAGAKTKQLAERDFGSVEKLMDHVTASGKATGIGWAVWAYSYLDQKTHVYALDEHQNNCPIGVVPLLILDVFEHAYFGDRFTDRASYIKDFWGDVNWNVVEKRAGNVPG